MEEIQSKLSSLQSSNLPRWVLKRLKTVGSTVKQETISQLKSSTSQWKSWSGLLCSVPGGNEKNGQVHPQVIEIITDISSTAEKFLRSVSYFALHH
ncbi:unnamed protein product [Arabidopsis halleri]